MLNLAVAQHEDVSISDIVIGDRFREEMGDIASLAASISDIGLLQPIVVTNDNRLVAGERRIRAFEALGWSRIPVRRVNLDSVIRGEHDENEMREDFRPSERVAIGKALEAEVGERRGGDMANGTIGPFEGERTRDIAARRAGFTSGKQYERAKSVVQAGAPELIEAMDSGRVAISTAATIATTPREEQAQIVARGEKEILEAAKEIKAKKTAEKRQQRVAKIVSIANDNAPIDTSKKYNVIYADPPWRYDYAETETRAIENQYPTMDIDDICALPVGDIAADDSILLMWGTAPKLREAFQVIDAWGFTYKTCAIWDKQKIGMGYYFRVQHEILMIATRGNLPVPVPDARERSVISIPYSKHSAKPHEFYGIIEKMYPEFPKIELFCRSPQPGWDVWGNQSGGLKDAA